jgi:hypothetical protein
MRPVPSSVSIDEPSQSHNIETPAQAISQMLMEYLTDNRHGMNQEQHYQEATESQLQPRETTRTRGFPDHTYIDPSKVSNIDNMVCAETKCSKTLSIHGTWPYCSRHTKTVEGLQIKNKNNTKRLFTTRTFPEESIVALFSGTTITRSEYANQIQQCTKGRAGDARKFACITADRSLFLDACSRPGHNGRFATFSRRDLEPNVDMVPLLNINRPEEPQHPFPAIVLVARHTIAPDEQIVVPRCTETIEKGLLEVNGDVPRLRNRGKKRRRSESDSDEHDTTHTRSKQSSSTPTSGKSKIKLKTLWAMPVSR